MSEPRRTRDFGAGLWGSGTREHTAEKGKVYAGQPLADALTAL